MSVTIAQLFGNRAALDSFVVNERDLWEAESLRQARELRRQHERYPFKSEETLPALLALIGDFPVPAVFTPVVKYHVLTLTTERQQKENVAALARVVREARARLSDVLTIPVRKPGNEMLHALLQTQDSRSRQIISLLTQVGDDVDEALE